MKVIESELVSHLECNGFDDGYVVQPSEVAINQLKLNKREGSSDLSTNHFKFTCSEFFVHTACLFSSILIHDAVLDDF
jgi:hypothetical protein